MQHIGERMNETRFPDAWNSFEQHMTAGKETRDRRLNNFFMADDAPPYFRRDPFEALAKLVDVRWNRCCRRCRHGTFGMRVKYRDTRPRRASGTGGGALTCVRS